MKFALLYSLVTVLFLTFILFNLFCFSDVVLHRRHQGGAKGVCQSIGRCM